MQQGTITVRTSMAEHLTTTESNENAELHDESQFILGQSSPDPLVESGYPTNMLPPVLGHSALVLCGDQLADYEALFKDRWQTIVRLATRRGLQEPDAQDVAQETLCVGLRLFTDPDTIARYPNNKLPTT